jgi:hypothetical protein
VVKNEKRQSYDNRPYGNTNAVIDKTYIQQIIPTAGSNWISG